MNGGIIEPSSVSAEIRFAGTPNPSPPSCGAGRRVGGREMWHGSAVLHHPPPHPSQTRGRDEFPAAAKRISAPMWLDQTPTRFALVQAAARHG
jgi:hypothetical protein